MWLNYVFNNSSETPQRLIELITTIYTPECRLGTSSCKFDGLKQNIEKKLDFQWKKTTGRKCVFDNRLLNMLDR